MSPSQSLERLKEALRTSSSEIIPPMREENSLEKERYSARRWLRLEAVADLGADREMHQDARRAWRNLIQGVSCQPDLWFEMRIEKSEDHSQPEAFWSLASTGPSPEAAKEALRIRERECARIFTLAEHFFRFQRISEVEPPPLRKLRRAMELGRRLAWMPSPTGRRLLLPCPWIPVGSLLQGLSQALKLQRGPARLLTRVCGAALTQTGRALLGYDQSPPRHAGFVTATKEPKTSAIPSVPPLFALHIWLETAADPSSACMQQLGLAITELPPSHGPYEEGVQSGGFHWDETGRAASLLEIPSLYYLCDLNEVMAVFCPPLPERQIPPPGAKTFFALCDKAPLATRGFSVLGLDVSRPGRIPLRVETERRREHLFLLGATGTGKSNLLQHLCLQSIRKGKAAVVIDFHGDLCEAILARLRPEDGSRLIYFNTADTDYPIGLNLLATDGDPARRALLQDRAIQSLLCLFEKQWPKDFMGPIFQMNVKNAFQLVLANPEGSTLLDVPLCFIGPDAFRERLLTRVTNPLVRNFWKRTYARTTDFHKSENLQYIVSKFTPLIENEVMRNIVGQPSSLDFRRILEEKQILLCSLNKGLIGEQHASLLATIITQKLEEAIYARADKAPRDRDDVFVYLDEVHNLAGENVGRLVSEARKFGVSLTFATQVLGQLEPKMREATLGNAATLVCFRVGASDTAVMADYFRAALDPSVLIRLPNYTAAVRLESDRLSRFAVVETLPPSPPMPPAITDTLRRESRERYARPRSIVEEEIFRRLESCVEDDPHD